MGGGGQRYKWCECVIRGGAVTNCGVLTLQTAAITRRGGRLEKDAVAPAVGSLVDIGAALDHVQAKGCVRSGENYVANLFPALLVVVGAQ